MSKLEYNILNQKKYEVSLNNVFKYILNWFNILFLRRV